MRRAQSCFVTACQQLLALFTVFAVLTPAARTVQLDVRHAAAPQSTAASVVGAGDSSARVATAPTSSTVRKIALDQTTVAGRRSGAGQSVLSAPTATTGYTAVGVTWSRTVSPAQAEAADLTLSIRTRQQGRWSVWKQLTYENDGPDPRSPDAARAIPGTDPLFVGEVDRVQARATTTGRLPSGLRLSVVEPGKAAPSAVQAPALQPGVGTTADGREAKGAGAVAGRLATTTTTTTTTASVTGKPQIYSRAQWGANESLRSASSLRYNEVRAAFVHHTVNANSYTREQVPALLRSIYAYHTQSRGWSDIGYNFLIDRFGRIWEGRYGGIDRPVVGAHTLGYNDWSFGVSAIGNFETAQPPAALIDAEARLIAWKLSLHGVAANATGQRVGSRTFPAINGHRDAGSTACPGKYLYAQLPAIRTKARALQASWAGRDRRVDHLNTASPDLVLRRSSDNRAVILPTGGMSHWAAVATSGTLPAGAKTTPSPDLTGDGRADLVVRTSAQTVIQPGIAGGFGAGIRRTTLFNGLTHLVAPGDLNGDRKNDLVGRDSTGRGFLYLGNGSGGFTKSRISTGWRAYTHLAPGGDLTGDRRRDLVARDSAGRLSVLPGNGRGGFGAARAVAGSYAGYDQIVGGGDLTGDGLSDLWVREKSTGRGYVLPGNGRAGFAARRGPYTFAPGLGQVGVLQMDGVRAADLVGVRGGRPTVLNATATFDTAAPVTTNVDLAGVTAVLNVGDWNGDGRGDLITRGSDGAMSLRLGQGSGRFAAPTVIARSFGGVRLLAAVGDVTGDGRPDLMGQPSGGKMMIYPGTGTGLAAGYVAHAAVSADAQIGVGRFDADGAPDSLFRKGDTLLLARGNGPGGITAPTPLSVNLRPYDWVVGVGDLGLGSLPDLVVRQRSNGSLWVLPGTSGGYGTPRLLTASTAGYNAAS